MTYLSHQEIENKFCNYWFEWITNKTNSLSVLQSEHPFTVQDWNKEEYDKYHALLYICEHPYLSLDIIRKNINYNWCWSQLSKNPNITWDFIIEFKSKHWNWSHLSKHKCINWTIITTNPQINWDWDSISENPNITWEHIQIKKYYSKWNWKILSKHPCINWKIIIENPQINWWWDNVSENPNIDINIVNNNPQIHWNWDKLAKHPNVPFKTIISTLNMITVDEINSFCSLKYLSWFANPTITEKDILELIHSTSPNLSPIINWDVLSYNKSISWEFIKKYENLFTGQNSGKGCKNISYNPNITGKIIDENPNYNWYPALFAKNKMPKWKDEWILNIKYNHIAALKIQRILRCCKYNPIYIQGQKTVMKHYNSLFDD